MQPQIKKISLSADRFCGHIQLDGQWLLNHPNFVKAMEAIYRLDTSCRKKGEEAVRHDSQFHKHTIRGEDYHLEYPGLLPKIQETIGELYKFFYSLFYRGIKLSTLNYDAFDRTAYKEQYWNANPFGQRICPVCLDKCKGDPEQELEHYFPKGSSAFVMLILHPYNLYFACSNCNGTYKYEAIPLNNHHDNLQTTFLPFHDAAENLADIHFEKCTKGHCVKIIPSNPNSPYIDERIRNLNRMFQLEDRWTQDLEGYASALIAGYMEEYHDDEYAVFKSDFENQVRRLEKSIKTNPEVTVQTNYYRWLLQEQNDSIFASITKKHNG